MVGRAGSQSSRLSCVHSTVVMVQTDKIRGPLRWQQTPSPSFPGRRAERPADRPGAPPPSSMGPPRFRGLITDENRALAGITRDRREDHAPRNRPSSGRRAGTSSPIEARAPAAPAGLGVRDDDFVGDSSPASPRKAEAFLGRDHVCPAVGHSFGGIARSRQAPRPSASVTLFCSGRAV